MCAVVCDMVCGWAHIIAHHVEEETHTERGIDNNFLFHLRKRDQIISPTHTQRVFVRKKSPRFYADVCVKLYSYRTYMCCGQI